MTSKKNQLSNDSNLAFFYQSLFFLLTIILVFPMALQSSEEINENYLSPDNQHILNNTINSIDTISRIKFKENQSDGFSLCFALGFSRLLNELCDSNIEKKSEISKRITRFSSLISKKAIHDWNDSLPHMREEISTYFNSNFEDIIALSDNDIFSKYRFFKYMVKKDDLLQWLDEWGLNEKSHALLKSIQSSYNEHINSCQYELLFPRNLSNESSARALLLNKLFKNANELFLFSRFIQMKSKIDTVWLQPYFSEGFYRYSYLCQTKNIDAPRVHIPENMTAVMHKVRVALKDALWVEEPKDQISYIFQDENIRISHADSLLISSAVSDFGIRNSHLRIRKERNDTTMKFDNQLKYIDSLVQDELLIIKYSISKELFQYLDSVPSRKISILINPSEFQDIFSLTIYWNVFRDLREFLINFDSNTFKSSIPLEMLDSLKIFDFQKVAKPISYSLFLNSLQQLSPKYFNICLLILCEYFNYCYVGDSETLENAIYFKRRLK
jgi:hypothetical protein